MEPESQIEYFTRLFKKHGDSAQALDWVSEKTQELRFQALTKVFTLVRGHFTNITLLDFGCGLGHYYQYLENTERLKEQDIHYCGVDINSEFINYAQLQHPEAEFFLSNELGDRIFDYVVCSGVFNYKSSEEDPNLYMKILRNLYRRADCGIAVNFQSGVVLQQLDFLERIRAQQKYNFYNLDAVVSTLSKEFKNISWSNDYLDNDFTIYITHQ